MAKIYRYNLNDKKDLNYVTSNDYNIQQMLDIVYEEGDLQNENKDDEELILYELEEKLLLQNIDEKLDIENLISLEPEDDEEWDPKEL
ncbi:10631_t:CDS:2, partial [Funneliformis geosporum]